VEFHRVVRELREACRTRSWERGVDRCETAIASLERLFGHPRLEPGDEQRLGSARLDFETILRELHSCRRSNATKRPRDLPPELLAKIVDILSIVNRLEGQFQMRMTEGNDGK
jgi:hypothetical protein